MTTTTRITTTSDPAPEPTSTPSGPGSALRAAAMLGAAADARTGELEKGRRVPADLYRAAAAAGLFRQLVPAELGGGGVGPLEWFRTGVELARHEASFGWVVTQGAAELGWIGAGGDPGWAAQLLSDPLATSASSIAGRASLAIDGRHSRFGGRWAFNTGCQGATWIGGLALVDGAHDERGRPVVRWGWVPADRAEVIEDWDASGLRGTGSHTTVIPDQQIPTAWTFNPAASSEHAAGPYRCVVGNGNWPIATSVAATQLGNARRALDEARAVIPEKAPAPDFALLATNAAVQRSLVEAEGLWRAALASVERELEAMWAEATDRGALTSERRTRLHGANVTASRLSVRVVDLACELTGTTAVTRSHVLGRCQRDAHALRGHISTGGASMEHNALVTLGLSASHVLV